ncbi:hypothetical protein [Kineococcus indalonis]|uniref:hypothetical protein n=1 Tax=Kineococcus indalonis TaxID=2696566 RepID=UPI00141210E8|nr:hypothetical protein [Kineococcus indalonis]NAZ87324.1 hypothetical protein [Kineococcus indalonis]
MPAEPVPRATAEAVACFVEREARSTQPLFGLADADADARAAWAGFVRQYRRAVRDRRELTADNLTHVLLDIALLFRHAPGFDPQWLRWRQADEELERGRA